MFLQRQLDSLPSDAVVETSGQLHRTSAHVSPAISRLSIAEIHPPFVAALCRRWSPDFLHPAETA